MFLLYLPEIRCVIGKACVACKIFRHFSFLAVTENTSLIVSLFCITVCYFNVLYSVVELWDAPIRIVVAGVNIIDTSEILAACYGDVGLIGDPRRILRLFMQAPKNLFSVT